MDENTQNNAGNPADGSQPGGQPGQGQPGGGEGSQNPSNQDNPGGGGNGGNPDSRDAQIQQLKQNLQALNKQLVDARRNSNQNRGQNPGQGGEGENPFASPEGQYAIALQLATGNLRDKMESVFDLYPELPATELSRIRKNPWAFASLQSYQNGDWESAALEIEQAMLNRVEELAAGQNPNGAGGQKKSSPVNVNQNPAAEPKVETVPGSDEDTDPWTMPLPKLEGEVAKIKKSKLNPAKS